MLHPRKSGFTGSQNATGLGPGASQPGCIGTGLTLGSPRGAGSGTGMEDAGMAGPPCVPIPRADGMPGAVLGGGLGGGRFAERGSGALSWGRPLKAPWL